MSRLDVSGVGVEIDGAILLADVTLTFGAHRVTGLLGPNGAGKTTLLRVAAGLRRPSTGSVRIDGADLHRTPARERARVVAFMEQESPDLILLDINLPRMDGTEVLGIIKSDPELKRIPVIMLTTSSSQDDIQRSYYKHANSYITKPGDLDEFSRQLRIIEDYWTSTAQLPPACS